MPTWGPRTRRLVLIHLTIALVTIAVIAAGLWNWLSGQWQPAPWIAAWLTSANLITFGYYGVDKWQARRRGDRVPEVVLHALSIVGGSFGAYAGMRTFRHKTAKGSFRLAFWSIFVAQAVLVIWLIARFADWA